MALSGEEQKQFELLQRRFNDDERDPIELAAQDLRTQRAARYLILGEETAYEEDQDVLVSQVGGEYRIGQREVMTALRLAEDKISHG